MNEVVVLEPDKVEGVTRPTADPAEAGGQAEQRTQACRVRRVHRLASQPHRYEDHCSFPAVLGGHGRRPGRLLRWNSQMQQNQGRVVQVCKQQKFRNFPIAVLRIRIRRDPKLFGLKDPNPKLFIIRFGSGSESRLGYSPFSH